MSDYDFKIIQHFTDLSSPQNGWAKELNLVSWNGSAPKYDIRSWSPDHTKMGKGVTLTDAEWEALAEWFQEQKTVNCVDKALLEEGSSVELNVDKNTLYLYFVRQPSEKVLSALKTNGWHNHGNECHWFGKDCPSNERLVLGITGYCFSEETARCGVSAEVRAEDTLTVQQDGIYSCNSESDADAVIYCINRYGIEIAVREVIKWSNGDDTYFIRESLFDSLPGRPFCRVIDENHALHDTGNYYGHLKESSLLHDYGYNVNQLDDIPDAQRRRILRMMVKREIMTKKEIAEFLGWLIGRNRSERMYQAVTKWKNDLDYVKRL